MNTDTSNWTPLKAPSINILVGKSSSGKTSRLGEWLVAYPRLHNTNFNKLTIIHGSGQTEFFETLTSRLPTNVQVVRRVELKPEFITKDVLRSENGHAVLVLGMCFCVASLARMHHVSRGFTDDRLQDLLSAKGVLEARLRQLIVEHVHHSRISLFVTLQASSFQNSLLATLLANTQTILLSFHDSNIFSVSYA